jgi:DnaJ-class molecular chaperone
MTNPYDTLGVLRTDSLETIKKKYKKLALLYHPDRTNGDPEKAEKFKEICNAYRKIISLDDDHTENDSADEDLFFTSFKENLMKNGEKIGNFIKNMDKDKLKKTVLGGLNNYYETNVSNETTQDIIVNVSVPVKDIYENIEKVISLEIRVPCPECDFPKRCVACLGKKAIVSKENFVFDAAETQVIFRECSNYEYTKKRGDVIINIFPKEGQFKILNRIHLMCECAVSEEVIFFDGTTYSFDTPGKHTIPNKGIKTGGNLIFYVF